jgi:hypothetical protein
VVGKALLSKMGDGYPEELRIPPKPVVALVRLQKLHAPLAQQLSTLGLKVMSVPDDDEAFPPEAKEHKSLAYYESYRASGILKQSWVIKHCNTTPVVVIVLFEWEEDQNWKTVESVVGRRIDGIKQATRHRPVRVLCCRVQHTTGPRLDEREDKERAMSFRRRADLEPNCFVSILIDATLQAARKVHAVARELANVSYQDETRRLKRLGSVVKTTQAALAVRIQIQIALYDEFRQDWRSAVNNYRIAYDQLTASLSQFPGPRRVEAKTIAEYMMYKISSLLLITMVSSQADDNRNEAIRQFRSHVRTYKSDATPSEVEFEHWAWLARQYRVFGELLEQAGSPDSRDRWIWPGLYFHAAAKYSVKRRQAARQLCSPELIEHQQSVPVASRGIRPRWAAFYGQFSEEVEYEIYKQLVVTEAGISHSEMLLEMLNRAYKQFKQRGCKRTMYFVVSEMAEEYYGRGEYDKARRLFESVSTSYRQEHWWSVLGNTLQRLLECAIMLDRGREFVIAAIELMATQEIPSGVSFGQNQLSNFKHTRLQAQTDVWQLIGLEPPGNLPFRLTATQVQTLQDADLSSAFQITEHPLITVNVAFKTAEIYSFQNFSFLLSVTVQVPSPTTFRSLRVLFNDGAYSVDLRHGEDDPSNKTPSREANLTFFPGVERRFEFEAAAAAATVQSVVYCTELHADIGSSAQILCLRWTAPDTAHASSLAIESPLATTSSESNPTPMKEVDGGHIAICVLPPAAKATLAIEHAEPALVDEYYRIAIVSSTPHTTVPV